MLHPTYDPNDLPEILGIDPELLLTIRINQDEVLSSETRALLWGADQDELPTPLRNGRYDS